MRAFFNDLKVLKVLKVLKDLKDLNDPNDLIISKKQYCYET